MKGFESKLPPSVVLSTIEYSQKWYKAYMQQKPCTVRSPKWPDSLRLVSAYVYCIAVYKAYVVSRHFARTNTMKKKAT